MVFSFLFAGCGQHQGWGFTGFKHISLHIAQLVKNPSAVQETWFDSWVRKIPWRRIGYPLPYSWASLVVQLVKNQPAIRETWVQSLGWEDPLEKGKDTHSSILAWRIPWTI